MELPRTILSTGRRALLLVATIALFACGGGGGGGTPSLGVENIRFTAIDQEVFEGTDPIASTTVIVDVKGDLHLLANSTIYVTLRDPDGLFGVPQVVASANGMNSQLLIGGRPSNQAAGDFRGNLTVSVCLDAACANPFLGSPFQIPYHVKVLPGLRVTPPTALGLASGFGDIPSDATAQIQLPSGAADFVAILGMAPGGVDPSYAMSIAHTPTSLTLQGRLAPVGTHSGLISVFAIGITSTGRQAQLSATLGATHAVAPVAGRSMAYSPPQVDLSTGSGSGWHTQEFVSVVAADGGQYQGAPRVEYLPGGSNGFHSAGSVQWLGLTLIGSGFGLAGPERYTVKYLLEVAPPCLVSNSCLPVGPYQALLYPRTTASVESPQPLSVVLTIHP